MAGERTPGVRVRSGPDPFDADETRGLYFVTEALAAALRFELDRRPSGQEAP